MIRCWLNEQDVGRLPWLLAPKRSYLLRSMVVCAHCNRRMRGRTIHQRRYTYYTCRPAEAHGPRAQQLWPDHPNSIAVREDYLLDGILDFFAKTIFHPERHQHLADQLATVEAHTLQAADRQRVACGAPSTISTRGPGGWCVPWS
jgi:hypothetical protein